MERLAIWLAGFLIETGVVAQNKRELYKHGFKICIKLSIFLILCFLISIKLDMLIEGIVLFVFVWNLRSYTNGLHIKSEVVCLCFSVALQAGILMLAKHVTVDETMAIILTLVLGAVSNIIGPVDDNVNLMDQRGREHFTTKMRKQIITILLFSVVAWIMKLELILSVITYGMLANLIFMVTGKIAYWRQSK